MKLETFRTAQEVAIKTAQIIIDLVKSKPKANIAFPTGRTMDAVYYQLSILATQTKCDFSQVNVFMVDEFLDIDQNHPQSYSTYLNEKLFSDLNFDKEKIFFISTKPNDVDEFCLNYEDKIQKLGGLDLVLLGLGMNGHVALNEPGSAIDSKTRVVAISGITLKSIKTQFKNPYEMPTRAITLGIQTIMSAKQVLLVVTGLSKAEVLYKVLKNPKTSDLPASLIRDFSNLIIIFDKEASSLITNGT